MINHVQARDYVDDVVAHVEMLAAYSQQSRQVMSHVLLILRSIQVSLHDASAGSGEDAYTNACRVMTILNAARSHPTMVLSDLPAEEIVILVWQLRYLRDTILV